MHQHAVKHMHVNFLGWPITSSTTCCALKHAASVAAPVQSGDSSHPNSPQNMQSKLSKKAPFYKYNELESKGATIVWGDPTKPSTYPRGSFDVVYDNNGKDLASCQPLIDHFKVRTFTCNLLLWTRRHLGRALGLHSRVEAPLRERSPHA